MGSYKVVQEKKWMENNEEIVDFVLDNTFQEKSIFYQVSKDKWNPKLRLLKEDYEKVSKPQEKKEEDPLIYLYNSHPTEEYAASTIGEYYLNPTIIMSNYILEDIFEKNGYRTIVEEESVKDILNKNNWNYASSYRASRQLLEKAKGQNPTLKYFIDIHRDSIPRDKTTIEIENREYAKILFIVGLENENYEANLLFTEKIDQKLKEYYPGLSKGIYKKEGPGVNGIYNQDFSPKTILVEVGGYENTTIEVLNTCIAFSKCFLEVINEENH